MRNLLTLGALIQIARSQMPTVYYLLPAALTPRWR